MSDTSSKPATGPVPTIAKKAMISTFGMTLMIITAVVSLRGLASQAEFGIQSIFWYILAAVLFLIPF